MKINNIHDLAEHFGTTAPMLEKVLHDRSRCDIYIAECPTQIRIGVEVPGCNTEFCIICKFPFESYPVDVFIDTICHNASVSYEGVFDDPVEMVMQMTDPGEEWTLEDAGHILGEAIAQGWKFSPDVDPQLILDIYNDMNEEEENEE